jgi:AcrR family transcriptional regulator
MVGTGRRETPLTRSAVIGAAVRLADAEGIARLSMRRLGDALDVEAMSLYHHIPNKTALLDAMVDVVFDEIALPSGGDWRAGLRARAVSQREVLLRHHWALAILESRATPGLATLRHHDAVLGYLRSSGFGVRATGHAYAVLDAYVFGFLLQERELPFDSDSAPDVAASIMRLHEDADLPHLGEFTREVVMPGGYDFADEFEVGLDLVLDAVGRLRG